MKSLLPNARKHDISFHASGRIDISAHIARKLSLTPGDVIDIARENNEMYIYVKLRSGRYVGRYEGRVWRTAGRRGTFRTCSKALAAAMIAAANTKDRLRCPCGEETERDGDKYITIIYRQAL